MILLKSNLTTLDYAKQANQRAETIYQYLKDNVKGTVFEKHFEDDKIWKHTLSLVHFRKNTFFTEEGKFVAMIPFLDSLSYGQDGHVYTWLSDENVVHVYETKPLKENEEVFRDTEDKCNGELYIKHNVFLKNVPIACVQLPPEVVNLNLDNNPELFAKRKEFAKTYGFMRSKKFKIFSNSLTQELLASVELMFMKSKHFEEVDEETQQKYSEEVRRDAQRYLYHYVKHRLQEYPKIDISKGASDKIKTALLVIEEEKRIMTEFLNTLDSMFNFEEKNVKDEL